jgi:16S rRNA U516 pseudouridylate synthase RsuA-like enzyme
MGTKHKQLQRKLAARKQEQHHREVQARVRRKPLVDMAAAMTDQVEAETEALTPDVIARLQQEDGVDPEMSAEMKAMGWRWHPVRKTFMSGWEAGP